MSAPSRLLLALGVTVLAGSAVAMPWPLPRAHPAAPAPEAQRATLDCVRGFSKDFCNGFVYRGEIDGSSCPTTFPSCKTLRIKRATFDVNMVSNRLTCGNVSDKPCDESPNGILKVASDFTIRLQENCPYRGCWESEKAEFTDTAGLVYTGTLMGTIGVGTHRLAGLTTCAQNPGTRNCEKCYDVSFDATTGLWRIGFEASYHGQALTGEELCISLSGDFYIRGDAAGGPFFDSDWTVAGTSDGTWLTFCP